MSLGSFILVQVGKAIIRIRPEKLGATLRRFKGAKEIKKPTDAQVDKSQTITKDLGNFNKADRKIVAKADKARPNLFETLFGTGRSSGQKIMKEVPTGESRRATQKLVMGTTAAGTTGFALGKDSEKDKGSTTKSKTKTYAEMVKEDKEKGKSKVLSRRAPDAPPKKPKQLKNKKDKKFNLKTGGKGTAKERLEEIQKEKLAAKQKALTGNTGLLASKKDLKPVPAGKKGKGLSMLSTSVRNNMGFMYGGGMPMPSKKPRMSTTDYRKASKGMLIISIDMKKKKPKTKKNKRG
jgi:hypothetical protein